VKKWSALANPFRYAPGIGQRRKKVLPMGPVKAVNHLPGWTGPKRFSRPPAPSHPFLFPSPSKGRKKEAVSGLAASVRRNELRRVVLLVYGRFRYRGTQCYGVVCRWEKAAGAIWLSTLLAAATPAEAVGESRLPMLAAAPIWVQVWPESVE
jgi:hypothetical protein